MSKIVELFIDENDELAGGEGIALVESPAHEVDFHAFSKNTDKEIVLNEEQQEFMLHKFNEVGQKEKDFILKGHYIRNIEYVGHFNVGKVENMFTNHQFNAEQVLKQNSILDYTDTNGNHKIRFKYVVRPGRPSIISTTRQFCREMINSDKIYKLEDINKLNNTFKSQYPGVGNWGDTFLRYGGPNCNHIFVRIDYVEFVRKDKIDYQVDSQQSREDAALQAGSNLNQKTKDNPSPQTVRRAGLGMFAEEVRFDDYPEVVRENSTRVLKYLEESGNPNDCLTLVGRNRAQQLANGENLSEETVRRMKAFLERHSGNPNKGKGYDVGCGDVALDAWGGLEALPWVEKKIRQIEKQEFKEEQRKQKLLAGPILIPEKLIYRREPITSSEYYVYFSRDTVKKIAYKYMRDDRTNNTNLEHNSKQSLDNVYLVESWLVTDPKNDKSIKYGYENLPEGTWMGIIKVDDETWDNYVETGKVKGFSLEGWFEQKIEQFFDTKFSQDEYILSEIVKLLKED
jgi:hypothetical protein